MQWISQCRFQDASTQTYLGSPSIVCLENGDLLATHDYFGPMAPRGCHDCLSALTSLYRSTDKGKSWQSVTHIIGAYWSSLFTHQGAVYLLGTTRKYGDIVIRRSDNGGDTWTSPVDVESGLLFRAGAGDDPPNYHCASTPVLLHNGRIYRAFEDDVRINRERDFAALVISCDADKDLLQATNWIMSNKVLYDQDADPPRFGGARGACWLEGNVVVDPAGQLLNILRVSSEPVADMVAVMQLSDDGTQLYFDPANFTYFPGGTHKFTVRKDEQTSLYFTLSNKNMNPRFASQRNVLSLHSSPDLRTWQQCAILIEDDQGLPEETSIRKTGFQYVDWQFDGDDIVYLVRAAYDNAHTFHDSNRIVFGRVKDFRSLLKA